MKLLASSASAHTHSWAQVSHVWKAITNHTRTFSTRITKQCTWFRFGFNHTQQAQYVQRKGPVAITTMPVVGRTRYDRIVNSQLVKLHCFRLLRPYRIKITPLVFSHTKLECHMQNAWVLLSACTAHVRRSRDTLGVLRHGCKKQAANVRPYSRLSIDPAAACQ